MSKEVSAAAPGLLTLTKSRISCDQTGSANTIRWLQHNQLSTLGTDCKVARSITPRTKVPKALLYGGGGGMVGGGGDGAGSTPRETLNTTDAVHMPNDWPLVLVTGAAA